MPYRTGSLEGAMIEEEKQRDRNTSGFDPDVYMTYEEWGKWLDQESRYFARVAAERTAALGLRDQKLTEAITANIRENYEPDDGKELSTRALNAVVRHIKRTLSWYDIIPPSLDAVTDQDNLEALQLQWVAEHTKDGEIPKTANKEEMADLQARYPWMKDGISAWVNSYEALWALFLEFEWKQDRIQKREEEERRIEQSAYRREMVIRRYAEEDDEAALEEYREYMLAGEEGSPPEDFKVLCDAKAKGESTASTVGMALRREIEQIKPYPSFLANIEKVSGYDFTTLRRNIGGKTIPEVQDSPKRATKLNFACRTALIEFFKEEQNAKQYIDISYESEWPIDLNDLEAVTQLLSTLSKDDKFLGAWINTIYEEADSEQTKRLRELNLR